MISTPPVISLVTCSFRQVRFLDATMRSVLEQGYPALDYIVIDGGSVDGSVQVIARYADRLSHWVSEPDNGQTDALIKGFAQARGSICGWLCSDDLLLPGTLHAVAEFFTANPKVRAVYGDALWIDALGKCIRPKREPAFNRFVFLHDHNYIPQPSMFWRRELYEEVGGLDPSFNLAMDSDLWDRFAERGHIAHMQRFLSCMRFYPEQKTRSLRPAGAREDQLIRQRRSPLSSRAWARPILSTAARVKRVAQKATVGGYAQGVPASLVDWLNAHETPKRDGAVGVAPPAA